MSVRKPILSLIAAALLAASIAAPADAQRGRGGGGGGDHNRGGDHRNDGGNRNSGGNWNRGGGGNWNNNHDWDRRYDRSHSSFSLSFGFGSPFYSYDYYRPYYRYSPGIAFYSSPGWSNGYGLAPYECRVDYEFGYWYGRPADIEVRRCADAYGSVYVVQGSQRLWRYR